MPRYVRRTVRRTPAYRGYGAYRSVARRPTRRLYGRGDYKSTLRSYGRFVTRKNVGPSTYRKQGASLGALLGAKGGPAGMAGGALAGAAAADLVKRLTGFGDYQVKKNSFLTGEPPRVNSSGRPGGGTIITFREYLGDVISNSSASTFDLISYPICPTNQATFPWLSQIASNYQEWVPHGIIFEYRSMSANALDSVNTALGQIIMATQYNATLPSYGSKAEMENTEFSKSIKPSESCIHMIECAKSASVLSNLYCDNSTVEDERFSVLGNFQIASNGVQGTSVNLGELWVSYTIELLKPKLFDALGEDVGVAKVNITAGLTGAAPLGTAWSLMAQSTLKLISPTSTVFTFPYSGVNKQYLFIYSVFGDSTAIVGMTFTATQGAALVSSMWDGSNTLFTPNYTGTTFIYQAIFSVAANSIAPIVTLSTGGTVPANYTRAEVDLFEVPNSYIFIANTISFLTAQG